MTRWIVLLRPRSELDPPSRAVVDSRPGAAEHSEAEIHAAVDEAGQYGIFVVAHAHGAEGIKRAVRAGVRSIERASYLDDEGSALMKKHGTWLVTDIYKGDCMRAATLTSAQLLAREKDLRSIATGKFVDLVAVEGDRLADIDRLRQLRGVVKAGRHIRPD